MPPGKDMQLTVERELRPNIAMQQGHFSQSRIYIQTGQRLGHSQKPIGSSSHLIQDLAIDARLEFQKTLLSIEDQRFVLF